jgi:hypothetical protein
VCGCTTKAAAQYTALERSIDPVLWLQVKAVESITTSERGKHLAEFPGIV